MNIIEHNIYLGDPLDEAVVGVSALEATGKSFETGILDDFKGNTIFCSQFLQLGHDTISDIRDACVLKEDSLKWILRVRSLKETPELQKLFLSKIWCLLC